MKDAVKIGVIGTGRIGRIHAINLSSRIAGANVSAVSDVNLTSAVETADASGSPKVYKDHKELINDPEVQAVVICSPTDLHSQMIVESAIAGKHIFCEKPIAINIESINKALAAVEKAGVKLHIGFNRRFDPHFAQAEKMIREGKIGNPQLVRITSRDPKPPPAQYAKSSGGMFLDMSIHDFDMARFLMGDEVEEVYASGSCLIDPEIGKAGDIDTATVVLRYKNGGLCSIDNSRKAVYGYDQRIEVMGSSGCLNVPNITPTQVKYWVQDGQREESPHNFFIERYKDSYVAELEAFVESILNNKPPPVSGKDGLLAVLIGIAANTSLREKRAVRVENGI